jgi:hypothetical protein
MPRYIDLEYTPKLRSVRSEDQDDEHEYKTYLFGQLDNPNYDAGLRSLIRAYIDNTYTPKGLFNAVPDLFHRFSETDYSYFSPKEPNAVNIYRGAMSDIFNRADVLNHETAHLKQMQNMPPTVMNNYPNDYLINLSEETGKAFHPSNVDKWGSPTYPAGVMANWVDTLKGDDMEALVDKYQPGSYFAANARGTHDGQYSSMPHEFAADLESLRERMRANGMDMLSDPLVNKALFKGKLFSHLPDVDTQRGAEHKEGIRRVLKQFEVK